MRPHPRRVARSAISEAVASAHPSPSQPNGVMRDLEANRMPLVVGASRPKRSLAVVTRGAVCLVRRRGRRGDGYREHPSGRLSL